MRIAARDVRADQPRVDRARERERGVGDHGLAGDEHGAVGERLELGDAVLLAARRGDVDAGAAEQRAVLAAVERAHHAHPLARGQIGDPGEDQLLAVAARRRPRGEHAVEALLVGVGDVGDRGDVASAGRAQRAGGLDHDRHDDRAGVARRRTRQRVLADRQQQRRAREHGALARALPDAVAARPVLHAERVEADRAGGGREQRRGDRRVDDRARLLARDRSEGRDARRARPHQVGQRERAHLAWRRGGGEHDLRAGAPQARGELGVGCAQADGRAERDDQDVRHGATTAAASRGRALMPRCAARSAGRP